MNPLIKRIYDAREYQKKKGWEKTYWAIDLHNTIIPSSYNKDKNDYKMYPFAAEALRELTKRNDVCIILFSSSFESELEKTRNFFVDYEIFIDFTNENPECPNTEYADFSKKFYFDVLIDDKAGFDTKWWEDIYYELLVLKAKDWAIERHKGQTRKNSNEPYSNHPIRVAELAGVTEQALMQSEDWKDSWDMRCAGYMHDLIEDTNTTWQEIAKNFTGRIADIVVILSKKDGENYLDFITRIKLDYTATKVKLADLKDNMRDLNEGSLKDKYRLAQCILENSI